MDERDRPRTRRFRSLVLVVPVLALCRAIAATAHGADPPWPTREWPLSSPAQQSLDADGLARLVELIRRGDEFPDLHGLLVVRNGYLVVEEYFAGHDADDLHMLQSVTKSFTSAAMGIAIAEGKIKGVEEHVLDFFPDPGRFENVDDRKLAQTLEDLLTMRSGTDYHERGPGSPHFQLNTLPRGWTEFILGRPMVRDPGTHFQYDSGGVILMSALLEARTGQHADAFLQERVFKPLGIEHAFWFKNAEGHPHTGGGLSLRPRDMAKFGLLYLRKGRWEGKQIVPADWVRASTRRQLEFPRDSGRFAGYGYLWWILPPDPQGDRQTDIYAACGFRAQYIFVIPEHDMVVVVTGGTRNRADMHRPVEFLYSHALPAAHPASRD